jgi:DNA helicase-2/ATP-dependent DNA helicase PcrA
MSESGTTPTALAQRMKCAIGGEADIPATQRFFVQGQRARGDRHLYAFRTRLIPEKLLGLFERTTWPVVSAGTAVRTASQGPKLDISARMRGMWR